MERPLALAGFESQSASAHVVTVLGGIVVFLLGYFGAVAAVYGDVSVLALEANIGAQRVGGVAGAVLAWAYFALAFVRGYGSPIGNAVVYPLVIVVVAPFLARWAVFGPDVLGLIDRFVGLFLLEPLVTTAIVVLPGLATGTTVLFLWATLLSDERRREWERTHLPAAFLEAFVDDSLE